VRRVELRAVMVAFAAEVRVSTTSQLFEVSAE
jgi:hypothetical protein